MPTETPAPEPDIRTLTSADEVPEWLDALSRGFLRGPASSDPERAYRSQLLHLDRTQGAYDRGGPGRRERCVATFRTFPQQLTVPGGAQLPACAITNVSVASTHRRRGLLSSMMRRALDAAVQRGDACATLISAEFPIYGRYGFGPATWAAEWQVDLARTGLDRHRAADAGSGRIDLLSLAEVRELGPELHRRFRAQPQRHGAVSRSDAWWQVNTGCHRYPDDGYRDRFWVLYSDADGTPQGLAAYTVQSDEEISLLRDTAEVRGLIALTDQAERALWHYLLTLDWVARVRTGVRAPDDVLPLLLPDRRAAEIKGHTDWLWLRPLDVPRLLTARTYAAPGELILQVTDEGGPAAGRWRLSWDGAEARCEPTREAPELTVDASALGSLYLGGESAVRLAQVGLATEDAPGAAARTDALLRTPRAPWCPDVF